MPKPTGVLHNCYCLTVLDQFVCYTKTMAQATMIANAILIYRGIEAEFEEVTKIEPWFIVIEGEF